MRGDRVEEAAKSLRLAYEACPDNIKALERLGEVTVLLGDKEAAARIWLEAAVSHERVGQAAEVQRCQKRADHLQPGVLAALAQIRESEPGAELEPAEEAGAAPAPSPHKAPPAAESSAPGAAPSPLTRPPLWTSGASGQTRLFTNHGACVVELTRLRGAVAT